MREKAKEEMASKAKEIIVHIRKVVVFSMRIIYRSGCKHPFVWGMVFFLLILYRYLPSLFGFVISFSPVVVCTALLLGTLLLYADANLPETEEEQNAVGLQKVGTGDNYVFSGDENLADTHVASRTAPLGEAEGIKVKRAQHRCYVSSRESTWQPCDEHDASSGLESDDAESSSPDASVSDIIPMLDELHPLLDVDAPLTELRSVDSSDVDSCATSRDQESDDGSIEEEIENQEDEEDEAQEEKDDANEVVIKWTADDQKNLIDLGTSELERNQRLENLIAKRRARKFLSFHAEKNLIDLDGDDPVPREDISRFNFQIPSISAPRRNPFDVPFEEDPMGPIPGSAPSVLQPRRNPFDIPLDQGEENTGLSRVTIHQQEFVPPPPRDIFFRGPESLALDASSSGEIKMETQDSIWKPYFVAEKIDSEGPGFVPFQREPSEKGDSKMSSTNESDTTSSDMDQEEHKETVEPEMPESHLLSLANHYARPVEGESQSSEEVDSVDASQEQIGVDEGMDMFTSGNHLISGELDSAGVAAPRRQDGSEVSSKDRPYGLDSGGSGDIWVASSILSSVDENESRSREINVIREGDVIKVGLSAVSKDFSHPVSPKLPKFVLPSYLFVPSSDNGFEGDAKIINGESSNVSIAGKPLTPRDVSPICKPLINTADLPTIHEEHSEHLPMDDY